MPYIELKTDKQLSGEVEAQLIRKFGEAIETFPGKTERYLMVNISGGNTMAFAGEVGNCCMVTVDLLGSASAEIYDKMTKLICSLVSKSLGIREDRIYVKYTEYDKWGYNGINF